MKATIIVVTLIVALAAGIADASVTSLGTNWLLNLSFSSGTTIGLATHSTSGFYSFTWALATNNGPTHSRAERRVWDILGILNPQGLNQTCRATITLFGTYGATILYTPLAFSSCQGDWSITNTVTGRTLHRAPLFVTPGSIGSYSVTYASTKNLCLQEGYTYMIRAVAVSDAMSSWPIGGVSSADMSSDTVPPPPGGDHFFWSLWSDVKFRTPCSANRCVADPTFIQADQRNPSLKDSFEEKCPE